MLRKSITLLGGWVIMKECFKISQTILLQLLKKQKNVAQIYGPKSYAVITGGAQGIGKAFALDLAGKGFNLILLDINEIQLAMTKQEILSTNEGIDIVTKIVDFSVPAFDSLEFIRTYDVSILVNNVGIGRGGIGAFDKIKMGFIQENLQVNICPAVFMTKLLLENMQKRAYRSLVITMSSAAALYPSPFSSTYGATKRFLIAFFESLHLEKTNSNIDILTLTPSIVSTQFVRGQKTFLAIEPSQLVSNAWKCSSFQEMGHWKHTFVYFILYKLMRPITTIIMKQQLKQFSNKFEQ